MAYETKPNRGSLFKNDRKTEDNHPDYTGKVLVGGVEYYLNAWTKKPEGKKPFFSLSFKPTIEKAAPAATGNDFSSDELLPF
jgi:uncharacterized protein (DUF736 family)